MASNTTPIYGLNVNTRERATVAQGNAFNQLSALQDEVNAWNVIEDQSCTIHGLHVTYSSGRNVAISLGAGLLVGKLIKTISSSSVELPANAHGSNSRAYVLEITNTSETPFQNETRVLLSAISRTDETAEAVGTGDGATKAFDLGQSGVYTPSLKVYLAATQVGGWVISKGTGSGGVDQILFYEAPAPSVAITADYTWVDGGVEGNATVPTLRRRDPVFNVVEGTADHPTTPTIPSATANSLVLATIIVPPSWTGSVAPTAINNSAKRWLTWPDNNVDSTSPAVAPNAGKLAYALQSIDQVVHGCRLYYEASDTLRVSAGWGVFGGVAWRIAEDLRLTVNPSTTGWHYVYLVPQPTSTHLAGATPVLTITNTPPTARRRQAGERRLYLGSVFVLGNEPVVYRPFWTHGDWVMYPAQIAADADPVGLIFPLTHDAEEDIGTAVPPTGTLFYARLSVGVTGNSGAELRATVNSRRALVNSAYGGLGGEWLHSMTARATVWAGDGVSADQEQCGILRAEHDGGDRLIYPVLVSAGTPSASSATLRVLGYLDDYRTMDDAGSPLLF
jgi:hypothetical protein